MSRVLELTDRHLGTGSTGSVIVRAAAPILGALVVALAVHLGVGAWLPDQTRVATSIGLFIMLAVSLNIVNGYTGQFSMGHAGFMAIGAYTAGPFSYYASLLLFGTPTAMEGFATPGHGAMVVGCILGAFVAAGFGFVVGLPSLRLRGDYLAIVTLGFGEIIRVLLQLTGRQVTWSGSHPIYELVKDDSPLAVRELLLNPTEAALAAAAKSPDLLARLTQVVNADDAKALASLWKEPAQTFVNLPLGGAVGFNGVAQYASLFWVFLFAGLTVVAAYRLKQSSAGRAFLSIREDEIAARAMGVNLTKYKVRAFVFAAFFAGLAGGFWAHSGVPLRPQDAGFQMSFEIVIMVVLGGMGSISGVIIAAAGLTILTELLKSQSAVIGNVKLADYRLIIYALLLVVTMILRPQGLMGVKEIWELGRGSRGEKGGKP